MKTSEKGLMWAAVYGAWSLVFFGGWIGFGVVLLVAAGLVAHAYEKAPSVGSRKPLQRACSVSEGQRCPLCHAGFAAAELAETCQGCGTLYHQGCREEWRVCSTLGCRNKRRTAKTQGESFRVKAGAPRRAPLISRIKIRIRPGASGSTHRASSILGPSIASRAEVPRKIPAAFPEGLSRDRLSQAANRVRQREPS